jgi:hypothetical protein
MFIIPIHVFQFTSIFVSDSWGREKSYLPNLGRGCKRFKNVVLAHALLSHSVCACLHTLSYIRNQYYCVTFCMSNQYYMYRVFQKE